jgi:hypothetical protein
MTNKKKHGTPWGPIFIATIVVLLVSAMYVPLEVPQPGAGQSFVLPANRSASVGHGAFGEKCEAPKGNIESFGNEIRQLLIRYNLHLMETGIRDDATASEVRGKLDYAERCWYGFTFEAANITEEDLTTVGYLPRGRRP